MRIICAATAKKTHMREKLSFFVAGIPKGQPRVKAFSRGKHAGVYDPGTSDGWKLLIRHEAQKAWDGVQWEGRCG